MRLTQLSNEIGDIECVNKTLSTESTCQVLSCQVQDRYVVSSIITNKVEVRRGGGH